MNKINSFKQFSRLWIGFDLNYIFQLIFLLDSSLSIGQHEPGCALMNERFDNCFILTVLTVTTILTITTVLTITTDWTVLIGQNGPNDSKCFW